MIFYLFLLFTLLPFIELAILIKIGMATNVWVPIALVLFTGMTGAALARWQGLRVYRRIREETLAGRMPADALVDGFLILLAGILLVTPGVLTDFVGLAFLIPPVRTLVKRGVKAWIRRNVEVHVSGMNAELWQTADRARQNGDDEIIDARVLGTHVEDADESR